MAKPSDNTQRIIDSQEKTIAYINPNSIDDVACELGFVGDSFLTIDTISKLSPVLNKNFIKLSQNFYNSKPPKNPVNGQRWINSEDRLAYVWFENSWIQSERDTTFDTFMYVKYDMKDVRDFVLDEFVFNYTINNIKILNQDMKDVKFSIDSFDSRKIVLKERNIITLYIIVFHPKDRITNPLINKKTEIFTTSGQTQFDISSFISDSDITTLSVTLNGILLKNNEFFVVNHVLNIDGMIYRIKKGDKLTIWLHGGSLSQYHSTFKIHASSNADYINIPKFFKNIENLEIIDIENKVSVNPLSTTEFDDYYHFEFVDKKNVIVNAKIRII